ncbi:HAD-IIB family hydrolase [Shimia aestuarii]|uniref:HAD-IIB family hydrolase n=1 Tax=Shimia aestuarii TaxID=254406 RepID=UPI00326039CE
MMRFLVFSDLDGTLLDHETYSFDAARPALAALAEAGCGVVLASSKTGPEIARLRAAMGLADWPAIVENGAGVLEAGAAPEAGTEYARLRSWLGALPSEMRAAFRGFGDMSDAEVAEVTGLAPNEAALARQRGFTEPGLWTGSEAALEAFLARAGEAGIAARQGGRFLTLSFGATKADRMAEIAARYAPEATVALGDAPNDVEMIEAADIGVIVQNPGGPGLPKLPKEEAGRIFRTQESGPHGWNRAVLSILSREI